LAGDQEAFIAIMMKDAPETCGIGAGQLLGNLFHHQIANRVGMAQSLALDDLDFTLGSRDRERLERLEPAAVDKNRGLLATSAPHRDLKGSRFLLAVRRCAVKIRSTPTAAKALNDVARWNPAVGLGRGFWNDWNRPQYCGGWREIGACGRA
jgi:hypothetical protein